MIFVLTTGVVFFANMFMYYNINKSIGSIDQVYVSNIGLNELMDSLNNLHGYIYEYLNTSPRFSKTIMSEQNYKNQSMTLGRDR